MTLTPAYGRDYKSKKAVLRDWNDGKDFTVSDMFSPYDGKPTNKQDMERSTETEVLIRYKNLTQIAAISLNK
tara:strand:+ start:233 stop:448 length:216 start_codon:yes stop_codon:yes gene_type:complete